MDFDAEVSTWQLCLKVVCIAWDLGLIAVCSTAKQSHCTCHTIFNNSEWGHCYHQSFRNVVQQWFNIPIMPNIHCLICLSKFFTLFSEKYISCLNHIVTNIIIHLKNTWQLYFFFFFTRFQWHLETIDFIYLFLSLS